MKTAANSVAPVVLQRLVARLEKDASLIAPQRLRERLEALDRLDAHLAFASAGACSIDFIEPDLYRRAAAICAQFESVNAELYAEIRAEIQRGRGPDALLRWAQPAAEMPPVNCEAPPLSASGLAYDYLDDLLGGVLQLEEPSAAPTPRNQEMVPYQPTPARHIFRLLRLTELAATDVFVDLGSGLGHVPLLISICAQAHCIGIELEAAYIERARQCAHRLNLDNVTFLNQDARDADLSAGTVFYLYTPFLGSILAAVLDRLRREATGRTIRVCSYGPVTPVIAQEHFLRAGSAPRTDRITLFRSRD